MKIGINILVLLVFSVFSIPFANGQGYDIGDAASDFKLPAVSGGEVGMADYPEARGFIVVFTCNTCPYAKAYEGRILDLDKKYASRGYPVIAINPNNPEVSSGDSFELMKVRAAEKGFTFPYLLDETQQVAKAYGAVCTPDFFGYNGDLQLQYRGRLDASRKESAPADARRDLFEAMKQVARTGQGPAEQIPSMGCSIKWLDEA